MKRYLPLRVLCLLMTASSVERRVLSFRVAFGYKDARPARFVSDLYEKVQLIQRLSQPCREKGQYSCGFTRAADDGDWLYRKLRTENGKQLLVNLRITASSASPDDEANRRDRFQEFLTQASEDNFLSGVRQAEATVYVGHSRDGGGPDFSPPRLRRDEHVDYSWYQKTQPGLNKMLAALKKNTVHRRRPLLRQPLRPQGQVLGLVSCRSTQLFARMIEKSSKAVELISANELVYYTDGLAMTERALTKIVAENL